MTRTLDSLGWAAIGLIVAFKIAVLGSFAFEKFTGRAPVFIGTANGAERCMFVLPGSGETGHDCSDAGFAWEASRRCPKLKAMFEPEEMLRYNPDFERGQRMFDTRTQIKDPDEACAYARRIYASNAKGLAILRVVNK